MKENQHIDSNQQYIGLHIQNVTPCTKTKSFDIIEYQIHSFVHHTNRNMSVCNIKKEIINWIEIHSYMKYPFGNIFVLFIQFVQRYGYRLQYCADDRLKTQWSCNFAYFLFYYYYISIFTILNLNPYIPYNMFNFTMRKNP